MKTGNLATPSQASGPAAGPAGWLRAAPVVVVLLLVMATPFLGAGTLAWPMAWVYLGLSLAGAVASRVAMLRAHPELYAERSRFTANEGTKAWDRAIVPLIGIVGPIAVGLMAGLDYRFGWPPAVSLGVQIAALLALLCAYFLSTWAMVANRFFSSVVRIQAERGQQVVKAGPYRWMRHPGYAAGVLGQLAIAPMLGSLWALVPAGMVAALYVLRTALEDRALQSELPGYREYAGQVRYRLLPGVW